MTTDLDLKRMERSTFRAAADSGLWDVFLAGVFAMFAVAPLLSGRLGDFWSAAVFVPVWVAVYAVIRAIQDRVVRPRIGYVRFAPSRRRRLTSLSLVMLVVNVVVFLLGIVAALRAPTGEYWLFPVSFSLMLLIGFTTAALVLQIPRLSLYGLLLAAAPFIGEALFQRGYVSHHGFPVVFGACAATIFVCGVVRFVRFLPPRPGSEGQALTGSVDE